MSEYDEIVDQQRLLLEAEEWAKGIKCIHAHSLSSMAYDDRPKDTDGKSVIDKEFNSGLIERYQNNKLIHIFGSGLTLNDLVRAYRRCS